LYQPFQESGVYFMSTVCGRPQGGEEGPAHVDACGQGEGGQKHDFFVDVINGWPQLLRCDVGHGCREPRRARVDISPGPSSFQ